MTPSITVSIRLFSLFAFNWFKSTCWNFLHLICSFSCFCIWVSCIESMYNDWCIFPMVWSLWCQLPNPNLQYFPNATNTTQCYNHWQPHIGLHLLIYQPIFNHPIFRWIALSYVEEIRTSNQHKVWKVQSRIAITSLLQPSLYHKTISFHFMDLEVKNAFELQSHIMKSMRAAWAEQ